MKRDNRSTGGNCPPIPKTTKGQARQRELTAMAASRRGVLAELNVRAAPLENAISCTALSLWGFFHDNGYMIRRSEWTGKTISSALCNYRGWVYAFYGSQDVPIYVGETGRTLMGRFGEHAKKQTWWPDWKTVKVLPCPNQSVRKVFESLIGLGGGYLANKMQPPGIDTILDDVILSLLLLGNDTGRLPTFPKKVAIE